ncbi:hypothetical protein ACN47A_11320 [Myxococcus fulvus]|uniref:hypothetical protein n=1 Tax=Myxococcus fulvus TaxID=33 RepID=UPI003B99333C
MHRLLKRGALACCVATLLAAPAALAGFTTESANCYKNPDGSGRCYGSLLGFRNHGGANTHAYFSRSSNATPFFYAALTTGSTTAYFSCTPDAATQAHWNKAMNHEGYFSIYWSVTGDCYSLFLTNGSQYSNF